MSSIAGQTVTRIRTHANPVVSGSEPITRFGVDGVSVRLIGKRTEQSTIQAVVFGSLAGVQAVYNAIAAAVGTNVVIIDSDLSVTYNMIATNLSPPRCSTAVKPGTQINIRMEFDLSGYKQ